MLEGVQVPRRNTNLAVGVELWIGVGSQLNVCFSCDIMVRISNGGFSWCVKKLDFFNLFIIKVKFPNRCRN